MQDEAAVVQTQSQTQSHTFSGLSSLPDGNLDCAEVTPTKQR